MRKKGQISTEYLIVFGIAFLIILVGVFAFMKFSKSGALQQESCLIATGEHSCLGVQVKITGVSVLISSVTPIVPVKAELVVDDTNKCTYTAPTGATEDNSLTIDMACALKDKMKLDHDFVVTYKDYDQDSGNVLDFEKTFTGHVKGTVQATT